ncbi:hypothetical protein AV530_015174 [Patagioenas fasciata monilis]|uniref:Uncharacterized protein n=1 Tax=Patagioenas fasciata monilis TaxID=372326 RepID=A0A1V4K1D2_PATFA|nr:hypothetical protein AV530_015174 [Patagioenas fasciata monilis]
MGEEFGECFSLDGGTRAAVTALTLPRAEDPSVGMALPTLKVRRSPIKMLSSGKRHRGMRPAAPLNDDLILLCGRT